MSAQSISSHRFIRKTQLSPGEYRKNFHQIDKDIIHTITSPEADEVTPLMSKIYLRLLNAPSKYWESNGVLRFEAEIREGKHLKAWSVLCDLVQVSSATANKAIAWMHKEGVIGYFAGKNGVGIRIFLNRAASSIGTRPTGQDKKILTFPRASSTDSATSSNETAFMDTYGDKEVSDIDFNSGAPEYGADRTVLDRATTDHRAESSGNALTAKPITETEFPQTQAATSRFASEMVKKLKADLEPSLRAIAAQAASREHDRTREWLEKRGLPKVARVAQREAYNVLRQCGAISSPSRRARSELIVGSHKGVQSGPRPLSPAEIEETAEICLWMLESRGQSIETTLAQISAESGGYLLAEDARKVREVALSALGKEECK